MRKEDIEMQFREKKKKQNKKTGKKPPKTAVQNE